MVEIEGFDCSGTAQIQGTATKSQPVDPKRFRLPGAVQILSLGASAKLNP